MRDATLVIGCVDNSFTRMEVDVACRTSGRTLIDLGSGFAVNESGDSVIASGGQVCISNPKGPCLQCLGFDVQGTENNYFLPGSSTPEPSSLLLNTVIASLAVECAINILIGTKLEFNKLSYDRRDFSVQMTEARRDPSCRVCGEQSEAHINSVMPERPFESLAQDARVLIRRP